MITTQQAGCGSFRDDKSVGEIDSRGVGAGHSTTPGVLSVSSMFKNPCENRRANVFKQSEKNRDDTLKES